MGRVFSEEQRKRRRELDRAAYAKNPEKYLKRVADRYRSSERVRAAARMAEKRYLAKKGAEHGAVLYASYGRNWHLKKKYGMTIGEYEAILRSQQGKCAICGSTVPGGRSSHFHVDHDHDTGFIRGLLCLGCNRGIGYLGDDAGRLYSAAEYLAESFRKQRKRILL